MRQAHRRQEELEKANSELTETIMQREREVIIGQYTLYGGVFFGAVLFDLIIMICVSDHETSEP